MDPTILTTLAAACRDHEIISFHYTTRENATARRRVEPHGLVTSAGLWYLVAYDTAKDDWRIYRLDRLTQPTPTGRRVAPRKLPANDAAAYVADKIAAAPVRHRALATVKASAETVRARTWAYPARVRPVDDTTCTVDLSSDTLSRIAQILAAIDAAYTLDADPDVLDHLEARARQTLEATRLTRSSPR